MMNSRIGRIANSSSLPAMWTFCKLPGPMRTAQVSTLRRGDPD